MPFGSFGHHLALAALLFGAGCPAAPPPPSPPAPAPARPAGSERAAVIPAAADGELATIGARFLEEYLRREPVRATELGDHTHDGSWPELGAAGEAGARALIARTRADLGRIAVADLGAQGAIDHAILSSRLDAWTFSLDELKPEVNDPSYWTGLLGDGLDPLVTRSFAPIEARMESLRARLEGVPEVVRAAKSRIGTPARIHTELAIDQAKGLVGLCKQGLAPHFAKVPDRKAALEAAAARAAASIEELQTFLAKEVLPRSTASFRLGRVRFEKKLRFALEDDVDIDALARSARQLVTTTQEEMVATASELWPTLFKGPVPARATPAARKALVKRVLDKLAEDRSTDATIVPDAKKLLAEATRFVADHDLVRVPDEPCDVIEMPEYRRGVSIAYCDASGPLEKKQETFYAISPTPKDWPPERALSFYREYNRSMLADLTVHEAMPGHFLQIMHGNRFHSPVRSVFASGPFIEGWAVYAEWLMAKHGFGGARVRIERQKMVLRLACNAVLDHDVHAGEMDEAAALALMKDEAFQEDGEAVAKWRRARLTSAQLSTYYYGFTEMMKLRTHAETQPGFTERAYHDELLRYGAPAMRYIRHLVRGRDATTP